MRYRDDYTYYEPSRPRKTVGGIKTQSRRGAFGNSWWARRWIEILESFRIGARLGRGRSYARSGQVLSISIDSGTVMAEVQGSRVRPYVVEIRVKTLPAKSWKKIAEKLAEKASYSARLLAGEMPRDIEEVFKEAGLSLFPAKSSDLVTDCSCPDWSNPCKHIAAVYYLLGEEFDRDPFLLFKLRGISREELVTLIHGKQKTPERGLPDSKPEPLPPDPARFWGEDAPSGDMVGEVVKAAVTAALPKSLSGFPFWQGQERLLDVLEPVYEVASRSGMKLSLGEWAEDDTGEES